MPTIPGVTLASGRAAVGSEEMTAWLPLFLEFMRRVHGIDLVLIKVADLSATAASAATHVGGFALDGRSWNLTAAQRALVIREATRLGLPIHYRIRAQGFDPHLHGMLDVGYRTNCSYQIAATRNGRDGLAANGPDLDKAYRPPLSAWQRYDAGITTMRRELAALDKETPEMITDADIARIVTAVRATPVTANGKSTGLIDHMAAGFVDDRTQVQALAGIAAQVRALADTVGADVDEGAIVAGVISGLSGMIRDTVRGAVAAEFADAAGAELDNIATRVVDELGRRVASAS